jgi:hypothetical protein
MKLRINEKETPNIEIKDGNFTDNITMIITIFSEISADGCDIEIVNGDKVLFKDSYRYGYNASYNRKYAKYAHQDAINAQKYGRTGYAEQPYIGDIITELCKKYNIDKHDIIFKQGKNVFNGNSVSSKKVSDFINNHIDGIVEESYKKLREQNVDIEVKHEGILEVPEGKNVDDLPLSHFVNLANKKGLSKITKALNNLQVWNKNDDPKLSKWAGDMIDKLNKKLKKDESLNMNLVKEDFIDDLVPDHVYSLSVLNDWWPDVIEQAKKLGIKDSEIDCKDENTLLFIVPAWDGLGYDRYARLHNWCITHIYNSPEYKEAYKELHESLTKESNNLYDYIDDMGFSSWGHRFGYKIYNEMTDDNIFILSGNERTAKEYGEWLADIYKNYDEETIEDELNEFDYVVSRSKSDVIVTNPEYWKDERKANEVYIVYEYDNFDIAYIVPIIGSWSGRF